MVICTFERCQLGLYSAAQVSVKCQSASVSVKLLLDLNPFSWNAKNTHTYTYFLTQWITMYLNRWENNILQTNNKFLCSQLCHMWLNVVNCVSYCRILSFATVCGIYGKAAVVVLLLVSITCNSGCILLKAMHSGYWHMLLLPGESGITGTMIFSYGNTLLKASERSILKASAWSRDHLENKRVLLLFASVKNFLWSHLLMRSCYIETYT